MNKDKWEFLFIMSIIAFIFFLGGAIFGTKQAENAMQREAVMKNHAAWVADANGNAAFEWKSAK